MTDDILVVRNARARRTRLSFDPVTGRARLTLPPRASAAKALAWARSQDAWIALQRDRLPQARPFVAGAVLPVDGRALTIDWRAEAARLPRIDGDRLLLGGAPEMVARRVEAWLRRQALALLERETAFYAARAGVVVTGVSVGDPRGRWGSCAHHGAIRYSWRLVLAPPEVRRATAAHEVAHRVHMDHSPAFHAVVAQLFGREPAAERAWLRTHGAALHWFGRSPGG
ncbi:putative metal-dependent hydrolase [Sphingomonas sp. BE138]|uniref:M48 family metallopeptidase n=1 Tax=Sphingomonas sp. BE138 TaxID=2817845 RepID=UPI0028668D03|nr:YgjP-like metallopeptidase domain-containing protein [Sphingomonas sp. BE138]MDR6789061.1 putative metal-dependent hydrolase [Sphingomonas sp. BE138]